MVPELGSVSREGIVLRGHRILLPKTLRSRVIDLAHAGHQGMVKTKRLIRSRVWFEGIDNAVSDHGQPMKSTHRKRLLEKGLFKGRQSSNKFDDGSPFQSHRFSEFAKKWGFKHRRVTPEWPRANGKAESFMKKLDKVLRTSNISGQHKGAGVLRVPTSFPTERHHTPRQESHPITSCSASVEAQASLACFPKLQAKERH